MIVIIFKSFNLKRSEKSTLEIKLIVSEILAPEKGRCFVKPRKLEIFPFQLLYLRKFSDPYKTKYFQKWTRIVQYLSDYNSKTVCFTKQKAFFEYIIMGKPMKQNGFKV